MFVGAFEDGRDSNATQLRPLSIVKNGPSFRWSNWLRHQYDRVDPFYGFAPPPRHIASSAGASVIPESREYFRCASSRLKLASIIQPNWAAACSVKIGTS